MQVVVEIMSGTVFHLQVGDNATVQDMKIAIQNQENLPSDRLTLLLDRGYDHFPMLDDQKPLSEYGVQDGSRVHVFFRPLEEEASDDYTGDDEVMDTDRTESETVDERDDNSSNDDSSSSSPKSPCEETSVESPEYIDVSD
ncbi:hypothetical protein HAX54_042628 [Datura stramonium]|uniref:Ubiquitin-like domain-containing protein n=1 Tax=Datura stramonium TaxID=4076 RepID=A0ABS8RNW1_DATST|nr:hypothetical protein [Datura stramonium]